MGQEWWGGTGRVSAGGRGCEKEWDEQVDQNALLQLLKNICYKPANTLTAHIIMMQNCLPQFIILFSNKQTKSIIHFVIHSS